MSRDAAHDSGRSGGYAPEAGCRGLRSSGTSGPDAAKPLGYATLKKAMDAIANEPRRVHGTESDPHLVSPQGRRCIVCGRVVRETA